MKVDKSFLANCEERLKELERFNNKIINEYWWQLYLNNFFDVFHDIDNKIEEILEI